jgi:transcriptional regulator with XRE-family HTH domain
MSKTKKLSNIKKGKVTDADKIIGVKLTKFRIERNLTLKTISEIFGVTVQQVQKYENGKNRLSISLLIKLCNVCSVNPSYFLDDLMDYTITKRVIKHYD